MPPANTESAAYLDQVSEVDRFLSEISDVKELALDTEGASFHRFLDRIYLLQISTRERNAIIDPLPIGSPAKLGQLLQSKEVEVVFHDADYDLRAGVLTGAGGTFSSGMDLKAFLKGERPTFPGRGLCGITQTPPRKPLIGAAEGWALAGGFELLLACVRLAGQKPARLPPQWRDAFMRLVGSAGARGAGEQTPDDNEDDAAGAADRRF